MTLQERLRKTCDEVRRKNYPLADLIPLMQGSADRIEELEAAHETAYSSGMVEGERICIKRIAELESALDVALEALDEIAQWVEYELGADLPTPKVADAIAKLKEMK